MPSIRGDTSPRWWPCCSPPSWWGPAFPWRWPTVGSAAKPRHDGRHDGGLSPPEAADAAAPLAARAVAALPPLRRRQPLRDLLPRAPALPALQLPDPPRGAP